MWVIRLVLFLLLLFLLVYVFATNADQTVDLRFMGRDYLDLSLFWIVAASVALGVIATLAGMGLREFRLRRELSRSRKAQASLERELGELRALPLKELSGETPAKDR